MGDKKPCLHARINAKKKREVTDVNSQDIYVFLPHHTTPNRVLTTIEQKTPLQNKVYQEL